MESYAFRSLYSNLTPYCAHIRVARVVGLSRSHPAHARRLKFRLTRWPQPTAIAIPFRLRSSDYLHEGISSPSWHLHSIGGSFPQSRPVPTRFHAVCPHGQR